MQWPERRGTVQTHQQDDKTPRSLLLRWGKSKRRPRSYSVQTHSSRQCDSIMAWQFCWRSQSDCAKHQLLHNALATCHYKGSSVVRGEIKSLEVQVWVKHKRRRRNEQMIKLPESEGILTVLSKLTLWEDQVVPLSLTAVWTLAWSDHPTG